MPKLQEEVEGIKIKVSIERCNYCGKTFVLQDDFGECRFGCPGNTTVLVDTHEISMSPRLAHSITKLIERKILEAKHKDAYDTLNALEEISMEADPIGAVEGYIKAWKEYLTQLKKEVDK